ncbi:MAG: glycosyltransferase family 39 protein [Chitinispirillaceae bacterium]|nr:glycosyltransferase family 39 protein [Chitinispirillaceae bacterium]
MTDAGGTQSPFLSAKRQPVSFFTRPSTHCLMLILIGSLLFIPFLGRIHLFDWDELNFAEASREMLETRNFMRVTVNYQPFWEKPPLFFWLQACSMKLFGVNEFSARLVNAVVGIITLLVVYGIGRRCFDPLFGLLWALAFAGSFLPHAFFKSGIIDPVFNLFIFCGLACAASVLTSGDRLKRRRKALLAGMFIGLAILTKGPVALIVVAVTLFICWAMARFKPFFSLKEMLLFTAAIVFVSALFYGIETALHGTWFIMEFIRYQIRLFRTGDAGHGRPFYFHFLILLFGCFPSSFFAVRSFRREAGYGEAQQTLNRLMAVLFWVVLVLFSIVKTKTVLYSSLCWFPIAYLAALHVRKLISGEVRWSRTLFVSFVVFTVLVGIAVAAFPLVMKRKELIMPLIRDRFAVACMRRPVPWSGAECLIGLGFLSLCTAAFVLIARRRIAAALAVLFIACAVCVQLTLIIIGPKIEAYTQGGPVAFYKKHSGEDEYVRSLFKSYADLFYGKKRPDDHPLSYDLEWLLRGKIDKPVYFVGRIRQDAKYGSPDYGLTRLAKEYGFVYYRREPEPLSAYACRRNRRWLMRPAFCSR